MFEFLTLKNSKQYKYGSYQAARADKGNGALN